MVLLQVRSTSNNAKGDKQVIRFRYNFVAMVILILSYKRGISLHVPLPMNVANARYHSLLGDAILFIEIAHQTRCIHADLQKRITIINVNYRVQAWCKVCVVPKEGTRVQKQNSLTS